jgi:alkylation response protein AidB-like acyl-CoA dehydrogenase
MDFKLSEEHQMIKDMCRKFADQVLKPKAAEYNREHKFPAKAIQQLGEMGIMGVVYPEEYGGAGMDYISYAIAVEEISRGGASTGVTVSAHNSLCLSPIYYFGTEEQKKKYMPKLCSGEHIGCFGITEPGAGSDASGTATRAERKNGKWVLNGTKSFITNGGVASVAVYNGKDSRMPGTRAFPCLSLKRGHPAFQWARWRTRWAFFLLPQPNLFLKTVKYPRKTFLVKRGRALK